MKNTRTLPTIILFYEVVLSFFFCGNYICVTNDISSIWKFIVIFGIRVNLVWLSRNVETTKDNFVIKLF